MIHSYVRNEDDTHSVGLWVPNANVPDCAVFRPLFRVFTFEQAVAAVNALNGGPHAVYLPAVEALNKPGRITKGDALRLLRRCAGWIAAVAGETSDPFSARTFVAEILAAINEKETDE